MAVEQPGIPEPFADGVLSGVAEGWIADIVGQAGGGDDGAEIGGLDVLQAVAGDDLAAHQGAQGASDATGLQAVGQAGTDIVALGKRKDLGLVLQAPERRGEDDAVVILLVGGAYRRARRRTGPQALGGRSFSQTSFLPHGRCPSVLHGRQQLVEGPPGLVEGRRRHDHLEEEKACAPR